MDTSQEYIRMSHAAFPDPPMLPVPPMHKVSEINQIEASALGNPVELPALIASVYVDSAGNWWADYNGHFVPLYRQDQLQAMYLSHRPHLRIWDYFGAFGRWCDEWDGDSGRFDTGETLSLAFVMHKIYNKRWDSKEWISTT